MRYYNRGIEEGLVEACSQFPVVLVTGPRQAGKSTLLQHALSDYTYVTLDDPGNRRLAEQDPELFLSSHKPPVIFDEIQYAPDLMPYLKIRVDANRHSYGQYILTGSQTFQLMQGVSETLAGRIALFELYPFSWHEVGDYPIDEQALADHLVQGFYPEFYVHTQLNWQKWFSSYVSTYLERDIRNLKAVSDLSIFQTFLSLLAARVGNLLNLSEIANECGISQPTAKSWLTLLEATYVVRLLRPYYRNRTKRLVKSPKIYFVDTGLLCYLLSIDSGSRLLLSKEMGSIFENMIIIDCLKELSYSTGRKELFFYRTLAGTEVDLLVEGGQDLHAYEIKFSKTPNRKMISPLQAFGKEYPEAKKTLLTLRKQELPIERGVSSKFWQKGINLDF